ncbi:MAG TPA: hypothetical protein VMN76_00560 [Acidobacteriota bacterium]|nr:hypothetical protein [Acidobacteriota bacterium]
MNKSAILVAALFLMASGPLGGAPSDIVGVWHCELYVDSVGQTFPSTLTVTLQEEGLSGVMEGHDRTFPAEHLEFAEGVLKFELRHPEEGAIRFELRLEENGLTGRASGQSFVGRVTGRRAE